MEVHKVLCLPRNLRRCPADARRRHAGRTSDPWASSKVLRLPRNLRRCPADARRRQGVHPTPWQAAKCCACHEICAGAQPTPDDARAYIRSRGKQQSATPATKSAPVPSRRQTTPGRTSDPLASSKVLRLPRNLRRCPADARRRQEGVHPTPWQAAKCCACHEICAGAQPTPDDARAYIRPLGKHLDAPMMCFGRRFYKASRMMSLAKNNAYDLRNSCVKLRNDAYIVAPTASFLRATSLTKK